MCWGDNGGHRRCCRGQPSEEGRGWGGGRSGTLSNRAEGEEELQGSLGFCQTDALANCSLLPLLVLMPHCSVCLLLHHPLSCQTSVSCVLEQDFPWSRCPQSCASDCLVVFKWGTNCSSLLFLHRNLWLFGHWRYKQGQSDGCPFCPQKQGRQSEQHVCWCRYELFLNFLLQFLKKQELNCLKCLFCVTQRCFFSRSAVTMCVLVSCGWDRWSEPLGASAGSGVPLGPVWSEQRHKQNLGLSAVPF